MVTEEWTFGGQYSRPNHQLLQWSTMSNQQGGDKIAGRIRSCDIKPGSTS
jgi:hypothetical protein